MTAASDLKPAERLLARYGVAEASDIDIEALAFTEGLTVKKDRLDGCDACLVAQGDKGVIIVSDRATPHRFRFSIAHEMGHWQFHRGMTAMCAAADIERGDRGRGAKDDERVAEAYASELLMPGFLIRPMLDGVRSLRWTQVRRFIPKRLPTGPLASPAALGSIVVMPIGPRSRNSATFQETIRR